MVSKLSKSVMFKENKILLNNDENSNFLWAKPLKSKKISNFLAKGEDFENIFYINENEDKSSIKQNETKKKREENQVI